MKTASLELILVKLKMVAQKNEDGNKGEGLSVILKTSSGPMMND